MRVTLLDLLRKSAYAAGEISLLRQTHSIGRRHVPNTAANRYNFRAVQSSASGSNISTSSEGKAPLAQTRVDLPAELLILSKFSDPRFFLQASGAGLPLSSNLQ